MIRFCVLALEAFLILLALQAVISWFPHKPHHHVGRLHAKMQKVTGPVLRPTRKVLKPIRLSAKRLLPGRVLVVDVAVLVVMLFVQLGIWVLESV